MMKAHRLSSFLGYLGVISSLAFLASSAAAGEAPGDTPRPLPCGARARLAASRSPVSALAFAPDGKTLASGSHDNTIRLWDVAGGNERRRLAGHEDWVSALAFAPDGKLLASASRDWTVRLWEPATGREVRRLQQHQAGVLALAFSPNGKTLASAGQDRTIILWDVATGNELRRLQSHLDWIIGLAFTPDGQTLLSASWDGTVRRWDPHSGKEREPVADRLGRLLTFALAPDGLMLAVASQHYPVRRWNLAANREQGTLGEPGQRFPCIAFTPDGKILLSGSRDGTIRRWSLADGAEYRPLGEQCHRLLCLAMAPDGKTLASGSSDNSVLLWDVTDQVNHKPAGRLTLTAQETADLWESLAGDDIPRANRAIWTLTRAPAALSLFKDKLHAVTVDSARITRLVAQLDDEKFPVRETAYRELAKLGKFAEPDLKQALQNRPSLEVRRRVEQLLERMEGVELAPYPDWVRARRALQILECMDTPEAGALLQGLAQGASLSWLTQEARTALRNQADRSRLKP